MGLNLSLMPSSPLRRAAVMPRATVCVVEDDPSVAEVARELCGAIGHAAAVYAAPAEFLHDCEAGPPAAVVLDWRLEREVGSATFMAIRHRFPVLPVVCWTATPARDLPIMVRADPWTRVVSKTAGIDAFEAALRWAVDDSGGGEGTTSDGRHLPHSA